VSLSHSQTHPCPLFLYVLASESIQPAYTVHTLYGKDVSRTSLESTCSSQKGFIVIQAALTPQSDTLSPAGSRWGWVQHPLVQYRVNEGSTDKIEV